MQLDVETVDVRRYGRLIPPYISLVPFKTLLCDTLYHGFRHALSQTSASAKIRWRKRYQEERNGPQRIPLIH